MARLSTIRSVQLSVAAAVLFFLASTGSGTAQRFPIDPGATVRVSRPDSVGDPFWYTGSVVYAAQDRLMLAETDGDTLVVYNETLSLEVRRGQRAFGGVGGGVGFLLGALIAISTLTEDANEDPDKASFGPALTWGAAGAVAGALIGSLIRLPRWEKVALQNGEIAMAPLEEPRGGPEFSLSRAVRWTQFEPTAADFQAFFDAHREELHPLEGIWMRTGTHFGIAIVRVPERDDTYAAYRLRPDIGPSHPSADGLMLFALTPGSSDETDWRFQIARESPRRFKATLGIGVLRLEYPGGAVDQWERRFPTEAR